MAKRIREVIGWVIFIVLIVMASEAAYLFRHREFSKIPVTVNIFFARAAATRGNIERAWDSFRNAGNAHQWYLSRYYTDRVPAQTEVPADLVDKEAFRQEFRQVVESIDIREMLAGELYHMAYYYYFLGIRAASYELDDWAEALLQKAVHLAPELSHYHVELANFYLAHNNPDRAKLALAYCLRFGWPTAHCTSYQESVDAGSASSPGFLLTEIQEYYKITPDTE